MSADHHAEFPSAGVAAILMLQATPSVWEARARPGARAPRDRAAAVQRPKRPAVARRHHEPGGRQMAEQAARSVFLGWAVGVNQAALRVDST